MSDQANTTATTEATPGPAPVSKMRETYEEKGRVVVMSQDQLAELQDFYGTFDETDPLTDWTTKLPEDGSFSGFAVVQTDQSKNRLIGLPAKAAAIANPSTMAWMYERLVRHILKVAAADDSVEAQFVSVDGCIKAKYDLTAFKEQAKQVVIWLRDQGLKGMTVSGLKTALSNASHAAASFPRAKPEQWKALLQRLIAIAEKKGQDTSLFAFWLATRDSRTDAGEDVMFDFDSLEIGDEPDVTAPTAATPT